jgi:DNA-binding NarL/FixJ family response regulator
LAVNENNILLSVNLHIPSEDVLKILDELQLEELTTSEFETFKMLAKGLSIAEIARDMNLSEKTINNYQTQIRIKLQLQTPAQLVHFALRNGIIKPTLSVDP